MTAPADGRILDTLPMHTPDDVCTLVAGLRAAQIEWQAMGVVGRAHRLGRFRDWLLDNRQQLVDLLASETGKSVATAMREFRIGVDALDFHRTRGADFLDGYPPRSQQPPSVAVQLAIAYRPCPVVGVVAPWTYPLGITLFDAVPALLSGSAVVVKPSAVTPLTVRAVISGWAESDAPAVFGFVAGRDAGPAVVDAVDYVHFTGSPETGKMVALRAAARLIPCRLELGGKSSAIVLADADLERAAAAIALGGLAEAGQNCHSIERVFVESACYDEFVPRLVAAVEDFAADDRVEVMTSAAHVRHVHEQIRDARAKGALLRAGGSGRDHTFEPTVLADVTPSMNVLTAQTLGPVLPVVRVATGDQAVALAGAPWGPVASVWTADDVAGGALAGRVVAARTAVNDVSVHLIPEQL